MYQDAPPPTVDQPAEIVEAAQAVTSLDRFDLSFSLTAASDYYFRGIVQRKDSFNLQPAVDLGFRVVEVEEVSLTLLGGVWNNFSDDTAPGSLGSFSEHWYEVDLYAGVALRHERWTLSGIYTWYLSPASDFDDIEDITFSLSFDDGGLWGDELAFALNPQVSLAVETRNAASGPDSGVWLGLGMEPTIDLGGTSLGPTTLSFPIGVGLSLHDYYQLADGSSSTFGYVEVGAKLSFDLAEALGAAAPTLELGASYLFLHGVLDDLNGRDSGEPVFYAGVGWSY